MSSKLESRAVFTSNSDEWTTPIELFEELDREFHFTLDPCATEQNAKCENFCTLQQNGLKQNWGGATSVLQSTVLRDRKLGREVLPRG